MQITIKKEHRYNAIKTVRSICAVFFCLCALFVSIQVAIIFVAVASADEDDFIEIHFCLDSFLFSFILHILKYGTPVSVLFLCQFVHRFFSVLFRSYNFRSLSCMRVYACFTFRYRINDRLAFVMWWNDFCACIFYSIYLFTISLWLIFIRLWFIDFRTKNNSVAQRHKSQCSCVELLAINIIFFLSIFDCVAVFKWILHCCCNGHLVGLK